MPLYEYACQDCQRDVELLIRGEEKPVCPQCKSLGMERKLSVFSAPVSSSGKPGGDFPPAGDCGRPQCGTFGCQGLG